MNKCNFFQTCPFKTQRGQTAFTLLEMLVVLVIISMVTLLLMQSLQYVLDLRVRFVQQLDDMQQGALRAYWFRSSTSALLPDYNPVPGIAQNRPLQLFKGTETGFSGLTLAGLEAPAGVPTAFAWQLTYEEGQTWLEYHTEQGQIWRILSWAGRHGHFAYLNAQGEWRNEWMQQQPFSFSSLSQGFSPKKPPPQLPEAIALHGTKRAQPFTWVVRIAGNKDDPYDYRTLFDPNNPL